MEEGCACEWPTPSGRTEQLVTPFPQLSSEDTPGVLGEPLDAPSSGLSCLCWFNARPWSSSNKSVLDGGPTACGRRTKPAKDPCCGGEGSCQPQHSSSEQVLEARIQAKMACAVLLSDPPRMNFSACHQKHPAPTKTCRSQVWGQAGGAKQLQVITWRSVMCPAALGTR